MFTSTAQSRRDFIASHVTPQREILELGPFNNPTFRRPDEQVWYMDMFSKAELISMHAGNSSRQPESIVETDYVVKDLDFARHISKTFDMVVAHHVVEHIADLIFWFRECEQLLKPNGMLFLSLPDRRYTFDYFRPISLASQIVRAAEEHPLKPPFWQVVDHFYYHQKVDTADIWAGNLPVKFTPRFSLAEAIQRAKKREDIYTDTHCWVFTSDSFVQCIADLRSASILNFSIKALQHPLKGSNEFRILLQKDSIAPGI